jgi:TATA-box binding protein (TBP) (component of TFIID and TFIIIB)
MDLDKIYQSSASTLRSTNVVVASSLHIFHKQRDDPDNQMTCMSDGVPRIRLNALARKYPGVLYHLPTFAAGNYRIIGNDLKCAFSIYESGTIVCMGTRDEVKALLAVHIMIRLLNKMGVSCALNKWNIYNRVFSVHVKSYLDLSLLTKRWGEHVKYNENIFPAATIECRKIEMPVKSHMTWEVFDSGKLNGTGADSAHEVREVFRWLYYNIFIHIMIPKTGRKKTDKKRITTNTNLNMRYGWEFNDAPLVIEDKDESELSDKGDEKNKQLALLSSLENIGKKIAC